MVETKKERKARSYVAGAVMILSELQYPGHVSANSEELTAARKLLDCASEVLDGKDEQREAKNAADRARRARKKTSSSPAKRKKTASAAKTDPAGVLDRF